MIFDTHCHYNLSPIYENWQAQWKKAQQHGVGKSLIPGSDIETSKRAVEIANQAKNLWAAVGVHPHNYNEISQADLPTTLTQHMSVLSILLDSPSVVAIGETGLDYFRLKEKGRDLAIQNQKAVFRAHIDLANQSEKVLIIHSRDEGENAYWDLLEILKAEYEFKKPFILHCASGPEKYIDEAVKLGAYVGVAGNVTYPNAERLRQLIKLVPPDRLLLETDAPYLPPQKFRGQTCEPWMIEETNRFVKENLGLDIDTNLVIA